MNQERHFELEEVEWHWLRLHLERDAVIVVSSDLDLTDAAARIAADDAEVVRTWIERGLIAKPSLEQVTAWNAEPAKRFRMLIVQPYVLVQDTSSEPG